MSLTFQLVKVENSNRYNENIDASILFKEVIALRKAMKLLSKTEDNYHRIDKVVSKMKELVSKNRLEYKSRIDLTNKFNTFVKIKSDKKYKFFNESISDDCGITKYDLDNPVSLKIDEEVPYNGTSSIKTIKAARDQALVELRALRKKRREIPSIEKEYTVPGLPFKPRYKVYSGGGYGSGEEKITYKDKWRGTDYTYDSSSCSNTFTIHYQAGEIMRLKEETKLRKVFESKVPLTNDHHVGIEIEFLSKSDKYGLAKLLAAKGLESYVCLKDDGSLKPDAEYKYTHELTVCVKESESKMVIKKIIEALDEGQSKVMNRCGLHVHLDMRTRDKDIVYNNLVKSQTILYAMNPRSRIDGTQANGARDTAWSKKIDISDFNGALEHCTRAGDRYHGINVLSYSKYKTIEIRIHSGSTNFEKINNWVEILTRIANSTEKFTTANSKPETFVERYGFDDTMLEYIKGRVAKFKDKEGNHITIDEVA